MAQMCDECAAAKQAEDARYRTIAPQAPPSAPPPPGASTLPGAPTLPGASGKCVCGQWVPLGAAFCPICGRATGAGPLQYAGFWMRLLAAIIDGIILGVVQAVVGLVISDPLASFGFNFLVSFGYTVGFWIAEGATPGKMAVGCKIVSEDGEPLSGGQAIGRYFGQILCVLTLGIGYLMIAWTPKKRSLADYVAGTVVIKTR
jgi:uncharacterized RDD family membrane protein YckC